MELDPGDRFLAKPGIIETNLDSELILLDPETQQMFSLNPVGRMIWQEIAARDVDGVADTIVDHFAVEKATALADVRELLTELFGAGLVTRVAGGR